MPGGRAEAGGGRRGGGGAATGAGAGAAGGLVPAGTGRPAAGRRVAPRRVARSPAGASAAGGAATAAAAGADGPAAARPEAFAAGAGIAIVPSVVAPPEPGQSRKEITAEASSRQHRAATTNEPPAPRLGTSPRARNVQTIPMWKASSTRRVA